MKKSLILGVLLIVLMVAGPAAAANCANVVTLPGNSGTGASLGYAVTPFTFTPVAGPVATDTTATLSQAALSVVSVSLTPLAGCSNDPVTPAEAAGPRTYLTNLRYGSGPAIATLEFQQYVYHVFAETDAISGNRGVGIVKVDTTTGAVVAQNLIVPQTAGQNFDPTAAVMSPIGNIPITGTLSGAGTRTATEAVYLLVSGVTLNAGFSDSYTLADLSDSTTGDAITHNSFLNNQIIIMSHTAVSSDIDIVQLNVGGGIGNAVGLAVTDPFSGIAVSSNAAGQTIAVGLTTTGGGQAPFLVLFDNGGITTGDVLYNIQEGTAGQFSNWNVVPATLNINAADDVIIGGQGTDRISGDNFGWYAAFDNTATVLFSEYINNADTQVSAADYDPVASAWFIGYQGSVGVIKRTIASVVWNFVKTSIGAATVNAAKVITEDGVSKYVLSGGLPGQPLYSLEPYFAVYDSTSGQNLEFTQLRNDPADITVSQAVHKAWYIGYNSISGVLSLTSNDGAGGDSFSPGPISIPEFSLTTMLIAILVAGGLLFVIRRRYR